MRHCAKILAFIISALTSLHGEGTVKYGFFNVVNMIPSANPCEIQLATKNLVPKGLQQGMETGWFMVPAGKHSMIARHSVHKEYSTHINVVDGISQIIVIFLNANEPSQADKEQKSANIQFAMLPAYESKGFALKAISTSPGKKRYQLAKNQIDLEFLKETDVPNWTGGGFTIQFNGHQIGSVSRGRERCSSYLIISTDHAGNFITAMANADIQQLPPWMKDEQEMPQ